MAERKDLYQFRSDEMMDCRQADIPSESSDSEDEIPTRIEVAVRPTYKPAKGPIRGIALIINQIEFSNGADHRKGAQNDVKKMSAALKGIKYQVVLCENYTFQQIKHQFGLLRDMDHSNFESIFVCIMTNGFKNGVLHASDRSYKRSFVEKELQLIPTLQGKPKLLFIEACRGYHPERAIEYRRSEYLDLRGPSVEEEQVSAESVDNNAHSEEDNPICLMPLQADTFIGYACTEGHCAYRWATGSRFISALAPAAALSSPAYYTTEFTLLFVDIARAVAIEDAAAGCHLQQPSCQITFNGLYKPQRM